MNPRLSLLLVALACCAEPAAYQAPVRPPSEGPFLADVVPPPGQTQTALAHDRTAVPAAPAGVQRDMVRVTMHVAGLTCPIVCAREVKAMLEKVPGVLHTYVAVSDQLVMCDVTKGTDPQTLVAAIKSPYRATLR
jgi:copper chaperone CopZ